MKCKECRMTLPYLGFGYYGHPIKMKFSMPMDGYLPEHWEKEMCSLVGITIKIP